MVQKYVCAHQRKGSAMPITYTIDPGMNLLITTATGTITLAEYRSYVEKREADPAYDPRMCGLFYAGAARIGFSTDEMREVARLYKAQLPDSCIKRSIVVSAECDFGMARMFQALAEDARLEFRIFKDFDAAFSWVTGPDST
jgi:hypothetical protein